MSEKLIVNVTPYETRVALLEGTNVREVFIERARERGIVGNIYLGRVQRVLPGMQAAFVEIGTSKAAFLYVGDVTAPVHKNDHSPSEETPKESEAQGEPKEKSTTSWRKKSKSKSVRRCSLRQLWCKPSSILFCVLAATY